MGAGRRIGIVLGFSFDMGGIGFSLHKVGVGCCDEEECHAASEFVFHFLWCIGCCLGRGGALVALNGSVSSIACDVGRFIIRIAIGLGFGDMFRGLLFIMDVGG